MRQRPFAPFRVIVSEGATYEIRHPEQLMVATDSVVIGVPSDEVDVTDDEDFISTTVLVDLIHVVRVEPIPAQKAKDKAAS